MDRNKLYQQGAGYTEMSLSARRAWIEMDWASVITAMTSVALRKESVDRNRAYEALWKTYLVALRKESVDRNIPSLPLIEPFTRRSPQGERG